MWEHLVEELAVVWAYFFLNPEQRKELLGGKKEKEDKDRENP